MGFKIGEHHSDEFQLHTNLFTWAPTPEIRNNIETIPGRPGVIDFGMEFGVREFILPSSFPMQDNFAEVSRLATELVDWINPYRGPQRIIFDEVPDRFWTVRLTDPIEMERLMKTVGTFDIKFTATEPFAQALVDEVYYIGTMNKNDPIWAKNFPGDEQWDITPTVTWDDIREIIWRDWTGGSEGVKWINRLNPDLILGYTREEMLNEAGDIHSFETNQGNLFSNPLIFVDANLEIGETVKFKFNGSPTIEVVGPLASNEVMEINTQAMTIRVMDKNGNFKRNGLMQYPELIWPTVEVGRNEIEITGGASRLNGIILKSNRRWV